MTHNNSHDIEPLIAAQTPTTKIRPNQGVGVFDFAEVWRYRGLLFQMVRRQLVLRIFSSPTSIVWNFVRPAIMTLAFYYLRRVSNADFGQDIPYTLFIFSGFCLWFLFAETVLQVAGSLASDASVIKQVYYPRIISPLSIALSRLMDLAIVVIAVAITQVFFGVGFDWNIVLILPVGLTMFMLALGLGAVFASLMLFHPDTRRILEIMLYLGLFLSPVIFSKSILPPTVQTYYPLNPMVGILTAARGSLFEPASIDYAAWAVSATLSGALLAIGLWMLSRAARLVGERL